MFFLPPRFCWLCVLPSRFGLLGIFIINIHPRWRSLKWLGSCCVWNPRFWICCMCVFTSRGHSFFSLLRLRISFWVMICDWVSSPTFLWHFSTICQAEKSLLVSPRFWVVVSLWLSRFGHDMAKNDSGIELITLSYVEPRFPFQFCSVMFSLRPQSYELLCWLFCWVSTGFGLWTV